jgi:hypothetical protein
MAEMTFIWKAILQIKSAQTRHATPGSLSEVADRSDEAKSVQLGVESAALCERPRLPARA